ncbi:AT-hook motif nuclear-localized protein 1 [Elaeis guineensis]|uniref:AT-hook motif nuclear-localized protein n=1 Tax=Elaeis guineensis var. tenera TaxID=51953 RepID=A0A6I9RZK7_ELAGV|nr:AT-hook motif nuclear-localized protein 1 [Elaeis guineensis]
MEGREEGAPAGVAVTVPAEAAGSCPPPPLPPEAMVTAEESGGGAAASALPAETATAPPPPPVAAVPVGPASVSVGMPVQKKKRGRPRKYGPDGSLVMPLYPMPISASVPAGEYPTVAAVGAAMKRGRGRPGGFVSKQQYGFELESLGEMVAYSAGANFTPHVITVAAGEDVTMKIISFSQQGPRAICILSANGVISNVTLRQPDSSGGTLTYEGRFELLSLSGSFMPTENGGTRSRSGGMSVSLASPDGRVVGGGVAGLLVAASPVQVVVGSFLPSYKLEQKTKKPKLETSSVSTPTAAVPISSMEMDEAYGSAQGLRSSAAPKTNLATSSTFRAENWAAPLQSTSGTRNSTTDINVSLPAG